MFIANNESSMANRTNMIGDHSVTDFSNLMNNDQSPEPRKKTLKKFSRRQQAEEKYKSDINVEEERQRNEQYEHKNYVSS